MTVNLDGRSTVIEMPSRAETILAATLRSRAGRAVQLHGWGLRHLPRAGRAG